MGGGGKQQTQTVENRDPWAGQQPYLREAFSEAQSIYNTQKGQLNPGYQGDFVAQVRPDAVSAFGKSLDFANNAGAAAANSAATGGMAATSMGLAGSGGAMSGLFGMANSDQTGANINAAGQYADNPFMSGMVDAAMRDGRRQLTEQVLPGIDRAAAGTGNLNSTRTAIAQGVAERGLAEKAADVSASLRGDAWTKGLGMAAGDADRRLQALTGLGGVAGDLTKTGLFGMGQSAEIAQKTADTATLANANLQGADQARLDNDLAKFEYNRQKPWENLANYWSIVGDKSWGGTTTGTSTVRNTPSAMQNIGMGAAILGSLFRCDARVKNLMGVVGRTTEGLKLYAFTYKDDPFEGLHIAPLAQDVEALYPEAVLEVGGVKHIDTNVYDWRG